MFCRGIEQIILLPHFTVPISTVVPAETKYGTAHIARMDTGIVAPYGTLNYEYRVYETVTHGVLMFRSMNSR